MIVFLPLRAAPASQCKNVSGEIRREMMVVALGKEPAYAYIFYLWR